MFKKNFILIMQNVGKEKYQRDDRGMLSQGRRHFLCSKERSDKNKRIIIIFRTQLYDDVNLYSLVLIVKSV